MRNFKRCRVGCDVGLYKALEYFLPWFQNHNVKLWLRVWKWEILNFVGLGCDVVLYKVLGFL